MNPPRHPRHRCLILLAALAASSVEAHHSFNMFDMGKSVMLHGTVKDLQWSNPHVILFVQTDGKGGEAPVLWSVECTSPGNLTRLGWTRKSFKAGDAVDVEIHPLRDGKMGGAFEKATLRETGQVITARFSDLEKAGQE